VDPRGTFWDGTDPIFRVSFWDERRAWSSDEYEVTGADIEAAFAWARSELPNKGTEFALYLLRRQPESGLVLLAGRNPTVAAKSQPFDPGR